MKKNTALFDHDLCPCKSGIPYEECCGKFHRHQALPSNAEQLMRSRYTAYVIKNIDYIIETTVPGQQPLLDKQAMRDWAESTKWLGLDILARKARSKIHENVAFNAYFQQNGEQQLHHENSLFVKIQARWFFVDHTQPLPAMKSLCLCGSNKKFKHCCGAFLREEQ